MRTQHTTRTREDGDTLTDTWSFSGTNPASASFNPYSYTSIMKDVVTPGYRKLQSQGRIINNDLDQYFEESKDHKIETYSQDFLRVIDNVPTHEYQISGTYASSRMLGMSGTSPLGFLELSFPDLDDLVDQAVVQAYANINASTFQALVTGAEARKSATTIAKTLWEAKNFLIGGMRVKRKLLKGLIKPKKAASAWLHYRYGLRPMYYEVKNALDAISTLKRPPRTVFRGYASYESQDSDEVTLTNFSSINRTVARSSSRKIEVSAGVLCSPRSDGWGRYASEMGLTDLTGSAWELVPFSFIVDWFLNAGDLIAAWTPKAGVDVLASWVVVREWYDRVNSLSSVSSKFMSLPGAISHDYQMLTSNGGPPLVETHVRRTRRWVNPDKPLIPSLDINLDVSKLVDLLALLKSFRS